MKENSHSNSVGIVLINLQSNNLISTALSNMNKNLFIKITSKDCEFINFIKDSVTEAQRKYNTNIYSIVSDKTSDLTLDSYIWFFECMSLRLKRLHDLVIKFVLVSQLKNVLLDKKLFDLKESLYKCGGETLIEVENDGYMNCLLLHNYILKNIKAIRQTLSSTQTELSDDSFNFLYDRQIESKLKSQAQILEFIVTKLKNQNFKYLIACELEDWYVLLNNNSNNDAKEFIKNTIETLSNDNVILMSNILHPMFKG